MEEKILELLEEICDDGIVKEQKDIDLFEEGLLDSLAFTELLIALEEQLNVTISPTEVDKQDINTPNKIISIVMEKRGD